MKARFFALSIAAIAVAVVAVPKASACGAHLNESSVITSPAFVDTSVSAPVVVPQMIDTTNMVTMPVYSDVITPSTNLIDLTPTINSVDLAPSCTF